MGSTEHKKVKTNHGSPKIEIMQARNKDSIGHKADSGKFLRILRRDDIRAPNKAYQIEEVELHNGLVTGIKFIGQPDTLVMILSKVGLALNPESVV